MAVNSTAWKRFPIAERNTQFKAEDAIVRLVNHAQGNVGTFNSAFLWRDSEGEANNKDSYRLPVVDVLNGRMTLIPHAVFAAARFMSGAQGGLETTITDEKERNKIKAVLNDIYAALQETYGDPRVVPPWLKGRTATEREQEARTMAASMETITAAVNSSGWNMMPIADPDRLWSGSEARNRVWTWADGNFTKYRKAFLWYDAEEPELRGSYKLPIADVIDGTLHIVPRAVNAVAQVLGGARGGVDIPDDDADAVQRIVQRIQQRFDGDDSRTASGFQDEAALVADAAPVAPPAEWFRNPHLNGPTPLAVTADGRVMGHLAAWNVCHSGIGQQCVMAPHSATGYQYFLNGSVLTADGSMIRVGKITLGTGHADTRLGYVPAAEHYDNTGTVAAVVATGEDQWGIWVAGSLTPDTTAAKAAELRRSPLSGDWRRINGNLELVAALAVNTPGFPIISLNASGEPDTLIAAGVVLDDGSVFAAATEVSVPVPADAGERLRVLGDYVTSMLQEQRAARFRKLIDES